MHPATRRFALAWPSLAVVIGTVAYGGSANAADQATATALSAQRASALSSRRPPPPPSTDSTLALVSASASGQAARGSVCGVSADGGKVLFSSDASNLVSGDGSFTQDLFVKDLNGNGITRVVAGTPFCLAMTPDANTVVYTSEAPSIFPPIRVKNLSTGAETVVTPPLSTFPNVTGYQFAGVSDDGSRVAFIAQPTSTEDRRPGTAGPAGKASASRGAKFAPLASATSACETSVVM